MKIKNAEELKLYFDILEKLRYIELLKASNKIHKIEKEGKKL